MNGGGPGRGAAAHRAAAAGRPAARLGRAMLLAAGLAAGGGCTDAHVELHVGADGAGRIRVRVLMPPDARRRVRQAADVVDRLGLSARSPMGAFADLVARYPGEDPAEVFARPEVLAELGRSLGPSLRLAEASRIRRSDARGFDATFRFPDVRGVRLPYAEGADLEAAGALCFDFVPGPTPLLKTFVAPVSQRTGRGGGASWSSRAAGWLGGVTGWHRTLETLFEGLRLRLDVVCSGPIRHSNAAFVRDAFAVRLFSVAGSEMNGADLQALLLVDDFAELADFRSRNPPGVRIEDPAKVVAIRFR